MANIIVTVVDDSDNPVQNAAVTVINGNNPQVLMTDPTGQATFQNLPAATYRVFASHQGFISGSASGALTAANDLPVRVTMTPVTEDPAAARGNFFRILTALQYLFLALLAGVFAYLLIKGVVNDKLDLSKTEDARGMITFVVSTVTVAIGLLLVMSAAFLSGSKDMEKRFAFGKDVFTVLVGVLGTIMGFYYGQTAKAGEINAGQPAGQTITIAAPQLNTTTPRIGSDLTLATTITGGTAPYKYTVVFTPPNAIASAAVTEKESKDGKINETFKVGSDPKLPGQPVTYKIEVKDSKGVTGTFDKGNFTPSQ